MRISVFRQGGWFWNPQWFGGHPTLGYSVLFPVLGALTSAAILGLLATTGAVAGFEVFVRDRPRATLATSAFAFGMISNFVVGRIPFALGCALAMACIATLGSSRIAAACLAVLASLSSPIAALFLVIVLAGWIAAKRAYAFGTLLVVAALGPALVLSVFLGTGGDFPFPFWSLVWCLALCALVASVFATAPVRVSCAVYTLVCLGAFAVASPLGGNLSRMPLLVAGPLVLLADPIRVWRVLLVVPVVVGWQAIEIAEVANATIADTSTTRDYYDGVLRFFDGVPGPVRVEIPATSQHWEAAYVGASVALARVAGSASSIGGSTPSSTTESIRSMRRATKRGCRRTACRMSRSRTPRSIRPRRRRARLVRSGLDYLTPVYRDAHWTVYRMDGTQDLLDGPGRLIAVDGRRIVFDGGTPAPSSSACVRRRHGRSRREMRVRAPAATTGSRSTWSHRAGSC